MFEATERLRDILENNHLLDDYDKATQQHIIQLNMEAFEYLLGNNLGPEARFDYIGNGAFKEAYKVIGADNLIIKFYSESNDTYQEEAIIDKAFDCGMEDFFIPTYFGELDFNLPTSYVCDEENPEYLSYETRRADGHYSWTYTRNEDYVVPELSGFEIQPCCHIMRNEKAEGMSYAYRKEFAPFSFSLFSIIDKETYNNFVSIINCKDWWEMAFAVYGYNKVHDFIQFVKDNYIHDLHWGNIGYYEVNGKKIPILLDWLS